VQPSLEDVFLDVVSRPSAAGPAADA